MENTHTAEELDRAADLLMKELGLPVDRTTDIWHYLKLGICKGIGMGIDKGAALFSNAIAKGRAAK